VWLIVPWLLAAKAPVASALEPIAAAFAGLEFDPPPKQTTRGNHYVVSNENHPQLFQQAISQRGGVYIGVGADQNYLMAGWSRPEVLVLFDFDQVVVDLHKVYRSFFLAAPEPGAFLALWNPENREKAEAAIAALYQGTELTEIKRVYGFSRKWVEIRLGRLVKRLEVPSFLTDREQYAFLVRLFREGRVHAIRGDLTQRRAMASISKASRSAGLVVRIVYLSNAEQYFTYRGPFRENFFDLPVDDKSLVLRTLPDGDDNYKYVLQAAGNFQAWLRSKKTISVFSIYNHRRPGGVGRLFVIDKQPPV
jgi:hypothetical protein